MRRQSEDLFQQRALGYVCIFTRSVEEATASLFRAVTAESGGIGGGEAFWLKLIEHWLGASELPISELNFSGARFTQEEWRIILEQVAAGLRRHQTSQ
jgi:hypothetical protein